MARSLSLAAYMAYARRGGPPLAVPDATRPEGELIWGHAPDAERAAALCQMAERLAQQRPGVRLLLTTPGETPPIEAHSLLLHQPVPPDLIAPVEAFLDHWRPDICLWTGGDLRPALLSTADARSIPLFLLDAEESQFDSPSWRWFPDLPRSLMDMFAHIQVRSEDAARQLRRLGVSDADITRAPPMRPEAVPLPYNEAEREELAVALRGRPLWLAAHLDPLELDTVLEARRSVARLSHRSLLIVVPHRDRDLPVLRERLKEERLPMIDWADGALPEETTQIILGEGRGELGLWYRLAPVSFIGNSLQSGMEGCNPNEPAVHGSAILYGPNVRRYLAEYSRFAEARAARIVRDATTLAAAVQSLIAPDQAAIMAHAAWDVASQGAEATDHILDLVQDTLDVVGVQ
ncbi:3-deoxy-D-manno-octulosonic acid transferase [Roseovarius faecimaris]|uniref:3-deoxy-D-manno-octulosonic acid transferase n=1 Tax=Roseovarius faecimaris TaxID=2494550 RepID=A0A6I6IWQ4_9RHOB|nr:glycosyltransferase N-terminal domain-containing protein [Roseovarius faecimaris]QGX99896.1 3-deoxy-D-manno-octulosonic acid transferase [Roseovarius faecimaris]